ncbi:MAG: methyltransferase domain-containing protein, partial [Kovacikia sp.]
YNLRQGIPFEDKSFDVIYHSHVLEHFNKREAQQFLGECHRVLRPRGIIRIAVPDLEQIAQLYLKAVEEAIKGSQEWAANHEWLMLEMYDQTVRNHSGGDMAVYLSQKTIPNEAFVLNRLGREAETLISTLRQPGYLLSKPLALSEREVILEELLGDEDYKALQAGRFRQSGEIHQWMYDRYSLSALLKAVAFEQVQICSASESQIPNFAQYYLDVEPDGRTRKPDSLFVEASKPESSEPVISPTVSENKLPVASCPPKNLQDLIQFQALQQTLQKLQLQLEESQHRIETMKSSKFWKLRSLWLKLKQKLGFKNNEN